jgi:pentose-5-phosphate-3-epimerase
MKTIAAYTNLELSDDIEDDYDALCESGLLNSVVNSFIGEYENVSMLLQMRCEYILSCNSIESQVGRFLDGILDKVAEMRKWLDEHGYAHVLISVDGSVSCERAKLMTEMGANVFVGGTAGVYRKGMTLEESIPQLRAAIAK